VAGCAGQVKEMFNIQQYSTSPMFFLQIVFLFDTNGCLKGLFIKYFRPRAFNGNFFYHQLILPHIDLYTISNPKTGLRQPLPIQIQPRHILTGIEITAIGYHSGPPPAVQFCHSFTPSFHSFENF
jgi:hypothetical protein